MHQSTKTTLLLSLILWASAPDALGDEVSFTQDFPLQVTPWLAAVDLPPFNPALGVLLETRITMEAHLEGFTAVENLSFAPPFMVICGGAEVSLQLVETATFDPAPGVAPVVASDLPCAFVESFDGAVDWQGDSATTLPFNDDAMVTSSTNYGVGFPNLVTGGQLTVHTLEHGALFSPAAVIPQLLQHRTSASITVTYVFDTTPNFTDLGFALAGITGLPRLEGIGSLVAGEPVTFIIENARERAPMYFILGPVQINAPFKGGVLVPEFMPTGLAVLFETNSMGELLLVATWPNGLPPGFNLYFQCWIEDFAGPEGYSATNALRGTTPP